MKIAGLLVLAQIFFSSLNATALVQIVCGSYSVKGKLKSSQAGVSVLEVYPGTKERFDISIHGFSVDDIVGYTDKVVQMKIGVYSVKNNTPRAQLEEHPKATHLDSSNAQSFVLLKKRSCNN